MALIQYLSLLRGINVGGNNIIKMSDLKSVFEIMGFSDVKTYIQSGNVLFRSDEKNTNSLTLMIEKTLSERFSYNSRVVTINEHQLHEVIGNAPNLFGTDNKNFRYDVIFLKETLSTQEAFEKIIPRKGVDNVWQGESVIYLSRLIIKAGQSYISKIIKLPEYKYMTIRNWNTTTKLFSLMEKVV